MTKTLQGLSNREVVSIKHLLQRGFLSKRIEFSGNVFLIKQVSKEEIYYSRDFLGIPRGEKGNYLFVKAGLAALSLVMVNGKNLLENRPDSLSDLVASLSTWHPSYLDTLLKEIHVLNQEYLDSSKTVFYFSDSSISRYMWKTEGSDIPNVAWPGCEKLGLNAVQKTWIFLQKMLDDWDEQDRLWSNLKWVIATQSSEALKKMESVEKERSHRREHLADILLGKRSPEQESDDIVEELHRSLTGEYDEHDMAVLSQEEQFLQEFVDSEQGLRKQEEAEVFNDMPIVEVESKEVPESYLLVKEQNRRRSLEVPEKQKPRMVLDKDRIYRE